MSELLRKAIKEYKAELEELFRDDERVWEMEQLLRKTIMESPEFVDMVLRGSGALSLSREDAAKVIARYIVKRLSPESLCGLLSLEPERMRLPPELPHEARAHMAKLVEEVRKVMVRYLHDRIGFPNEDDLRVIDEVKELSKVAVKVVEVEEELVEGTYREAYVPPEDAKTELRIARRKPRRVPARPVRRRREMKGKPPRVHGVIRKLMQLRRARNALDAFERHEKLVDEGYLNTYAETVGRESYELVSKLVKPSEVGDKLILDIGCGSHSPLIRFLRDKGVRGNVIGMDFNELSVRTAQRGFRENDFLMAFYPYSLSIFRDGVFDLAFAINSLHYTNKPELYATLLLVDRWLKEGGKIFIVHPSAKQWRQRHEETAEFIKNLGYEIEMDEEVVIVWPPTKGWPEGKRAYRFVLIARKQKHEDRAAELTKALAMSYLQTAYPVKACKLASRLNLSLKDLEKEMIEGGFLERRERIKRVPRIPAPDIEAVVKRDVRRYLDQETYVMDERTRTLDGKVLSYLNQGLRFPPYNILLSEMTWELFQHYAKRAREDKEFRDYIREEAERIRKK
jgi:SAM-dependent methyltransferase